MNSKDIALLVLMMLTALWTVMGRSLLKATIGLAVTSVFITIMMFRMNAPLAAVFELSVCAGLMTVIFVSAISLTKPLTHSEMVKTSKERLKRFWYLPLIIVAVAAWLLTLKIPSIPVTPEGKYLLDVREVMWNIRQLDIFGQIIIIIAGAIGVVILFEEKKPDAW